MAPGTHFLFSWLSTVSVLHSRRERVLVALSGITPDLDGLGIVVDWLTGTTHLYFKYHHYLGHGILSALLISILASLLAKTQKLAVFLLSFFVVHLHILGDVVGSKGPDGYQWPIYYLYPFNKSFQLTWSGQWELDAWQNVIITFVLLGGCIFYAATRKITFFEVFHPKLEHEVFAMYDRYFRRNR